jgi:hypothetical protein
MTASHRFSELLPDLVFLNFEDTELTGPVSSKVRV